MKNIMKAYYKAKTLKGVNAEFIATKAAQKAGLSNEQITALIRDIRKAG